MPTHYPASPAVLVVGDDPKEQKLIARALRWREETLVFVEDVPQALDYLGAVEEGCWDSPSLVILSTALDSSGLLAVVQRMRACEFTLQAPAVMLVADLPAWAIARAYASGVTSCVPRPTDGAAFVRTVEQTAHYWLSLNAPIASRRQSVVLGPRLPFADVPEDRFLRAM